MELHISTPPPPRLTVYGTMGNTRTYIVNRHRGHECVEPVYNSCGRAASRPSFTAPSRFLSANLFVASYKLVISGNNVIGDARHRWRCEIRSAGRGKKREIESRGEEWTFSFEEYMLHTVAQVVLPSIRYLIFGIIIFAFIACNFFFFCIINVFYFILLFFVLLCNFVVL